ncbi:acyl-CoA thioesterase II [Agrococcus versicolor]|uniref:Acyl-CoA thioesterase II n=2 Tax=Agrococcus versicolor TaxID=501482 RepID=A0ABN3ANI2_9MICO
MSGAAPDLPPPPPSDPMALLRETLDLVDTGARTSEDIFTGPSHWMPLGRVYGGQVMAQSVVAAQRTVAADRSIHSVHGYFLRPGDVSKPITFSVDRIHDGRSFATRRTQAYQGGVPILSMIASFQDDDAGAESQSPMPEGMPDPDSLPSASELLGGIDHPVAQHWSRGRPFDLRHVEGPIYLHDRDRPRSGVQHVWVRAVGALGGDDAMHRAALAYLSDYAILEPVLRLNGYAWSSRDIKVASLDHAVWWHRPARVDEWLLMTLEVSSTGGGRGLTQARIHAQDGTHVATVAQEGMVRLPIEG